MDTKQRTIPQERNNSKSLLNEPLLNKKQISNDNKPRMYQKVRELLSAVHSDLSQDIINNKGE